MKSRKVELSVGCLVLLSLLSLSVLALQVSGLTDWKAKKSYLIHAEFSNIGGLKVRSKVCIGGVVIGRVADIRLNPVDYFPIVDLAIDEIYHLPKDSQAGILTAGLLGDNYIGLTPGYSQETLKTGDTIDVASTQSAVILENLISKFVADKAR